MEDDEALHYTDNDYYEAYIEDDLSWWEYTDGPGESHILNDHICLEQHEIHQNHEQFDNGIIPPLTEFSDYTEQVEDKISKRVEESGCPRVSFSAHKSGNHNPY